MRTIGDIYEEYQTPPWVQLHQLRVAAIGKTVAEARGDVDVDFVVTSCLLHDIGALVKFDLTLSSQLPGLCPPDELPQWVEIQRKFRERYGEKEHPATDAILGELGLTRVQELLRKTGIGQIKKILAGRDMNLWALEYADMRVSPLGVRTLAERLNDVRERYRHTLGEERYAAFGETIDTALEIEQQLFEGARITSEDISDEALEPLFEELRVYKIR